MMLKRQIIASGLLVIFSSLPLSAVANKLIDGTIVPSCNDYTVSIDAIDLRKDTWYKVKYKLNLSCTPSPTGDLKGAFRFNSGDSNTASASTTASWGADLMPQGTCTVEGKATLTSSGSTVQLGPTQFSCPINPVCVIPPEGTQIGGAPVSWNKFNTSGDSDVVWVNAHIGRPSGVATNTLTTVQYTQVLLTVNGVEYPLPDGTLVFDPNASTTPTTTFDAMAGPNGLWTTTLNPNALSDEIFFVGGGIPVDSNLTGGGGATLTYWTGSSDNNLAFDWQWSAAVYTYWPGNAAADILAYHDSLHAGTPLNTAVQQSLIQGPRGGGGSNFTGSWSGTGHGACPGAN